MRNRATMAALAATVLAAAWGGIDGARADPIAVGSEHCVVNVAGDDRLNVRALPANGAPIVAQVPYGGCGIMVQAECQDRWCPVERGQTIGWVHRNFIAMVSPALYCVFGVEAKDELNLRAFPSVQSRVIAALPPDLCNIAFLPFAVGNWQKVRAAGFEGWTNRRYLSGQ